MRKLCFALTALTIVAALHFLPGCVHRRGEEAPEETLLKKEGVHVRLILPAEVFDPAQSSQAVIRCLVRNNTYDTIYVPVGYDSRQCVLAADGGHGAEMVLGYRHPPERALPLTPLKPGEERIVFELPLDSILARPWPRDEANVFVWGWPLQAAPPASPIGDGADRSPSATFRATLTLDGKRHESNQVNLIVKQG